jgi:hypothetical protein
MQQNVIHIQSRLYTAILHLLYFFKTFCSCFFLFLFFFLSAPLKSAWHLQGGGDNVGRLTYRVVGSWLNPALVGEAIISLDVALTGNCVPTTVSVTAGANQDCAIGSWSRETGCSQSCGAGMRTRTRYIVTEARGTGLRCPRQTCGAGCISQNITCNGATDNPLLCANCVGANNCKCRAAEPRCDDTLQCVGNTICRSPTAPPLGCEGCECKPDFQSPCEFGLICRDGLCQALDRGCAGCLCEADSTCNLGLTCGGIKVCVQSISDSPSPSVRVCNEGTKDCPCVAGNKCASVDLTCTGNFCRAPFAPTNQPSQSPSTSPNVLPIVLGVLGAVCVLAVAAVVFVVSILRWGSSRSKSKTMPPHQHQSSTMSDSTFASHQQPPPSSRYVDSAGDLHSAREASYTNLGTMEGAVGYSSRISNPTANQHYDNLQSHEVLSLK